MERPRAATEDHRRPSWPQARSFPPAVGVLPILAGLELFAERARGHRGYYADANFRRGGRWLWWNADLFGS
jgi:hypothetical protein